MQTALEAHLETYNTKRPHQGRGMKDRTPLKAFLDSIPKTAPKETKPQGTTDQANAA